MKKLSVQEIREMWIEFFKEKDHYIVEPKPIVPHNDKSILFINSGVSTLKKYFDGSEVPPSKRLSNIQNSLRTNDIENVGITSRHQTLFEMLGNFSIGDYFKEEAIEMAYELITSTKWFDISVDKLYFTVHPNDTTAYNKWIQLGINESRIVKTYDNFWEIGKGPGGPNSEIFYDRGSKYDKRDVRELLEKDLENDRIIEIWNLVFSEFNCDPENKKQEEYDLLPQQNIDTGMGLERMACILQDVDTNFETDEFEKIMKHIEEITNTKYEDNKKAYRIISDHIRALTFAISDGALPSNEGRGYVLRRLLRRAIKFGYMDLNIREPFLIDLVDNVTKTMSAFYKNIEKNNEYIKEVILLEEQRFFASLEKGLKIFNDQIKTSKKLDGESAFLLYDTFGFPIEITLELASENGVEVDIKKYEELLEMQRNRARNAMKKETAISSQNTYLKEININSEFVGYDTNNLDMQSKIVLMTDLEKTIDKAIDDTIYVILDKTPFYATSGGQNGDIGTIDGNKVIETIKLPNNQHAHKVVVTNEIKTGDLINVNVDKQVRTNTTKNHSATHLLHKALHLFVGKNALQQGSFQDDKKTRFDFSSLKQLNEEKLLEIEKYVNAEISKDHNVTTQIMKKEDAFKLDVMALFGEKYADNVRVVTMGESIELCGGTHVTSTKEIEKFYILSETGIGSGVRRIEALTSSNLDTYASEEKEKLNKLLKDSTNDLNNNKLINTIEIEKSINSINRLSKLYPNMFETIINDLNEIITKNNELKVKQKNNMENKVSDVSKMLKEKLTTVDNINKIDEFVEEVDVKQLREISDIVMNEVENLILILQLKENNKVSIIVRISDNLTTQYNANDIIKEVVSKHEGRGGGKPNFAQGGYQL